MVPDTPLVQVPQGCIVIFKKILVGWFKRDIAKFVVKCRNFQQVKVEHQRSGGLKQIMDVPTLEREDINMNFVGGLPWTRRLKYLIWAIVNRLTKSIHFIPVKSTYSVEEYARIYLNEIVSCHWIPLSVISHWGSQLTFFLGDFSKGARYSSET